MFLGAWIEVTARRFMVGFMIAASRLMDVESDPLVGGQASDFLLEQNTAGSHAG